MRRPSPAACAALAALALAALAPTSAPAQTPFTAPGLGYPTPPVDARAAALGGVGTGLMDGTFSVRNPADLTEFADPSLAVSAAPEGVTLRDGTGSHETGRSRFSVIRAVVPLGAWSASVGFASELDQDWTFRDRDTLDISTGRFPFEERRTNDGGISSIDLSVARSLGPLSVGVSWQRLTGELRQELVRRFEVAVDSTVLEPPETVRQQTLWNYSSWRLRAGASLEVGDRVRIGGAYAWTDDLEAENDSLGLTRTFPMPDSWTAGASVRLADDWLLSAGGGWKGWSETGPALGEERARDVTWGGAGLEFGGLELGPVPLDLRVGGRFTELPFARPERDFASEEAITLGLGSALASGRAELDFSLELGSRGELPATGVEESFTRFTFTATLHQ